MTRPLLFTLLLLALNSAAAQPPAPALAAFDTYVAQAEQHLTQPPPVASSTVQHLPTPTVPGAILHHWRATAFAPGATPAAFERLLRDFNAYPQHFAPQVLAAHSLPPQGDTLHLWLRVRQHHVLTVVLDSTYDVTFTSGASTSRSTRIYELDANQQPLSPQQEHGFLWRLNTYWTWQQRPGGLFLQVETISLSRAIPSGLNWLLRPYVDQVPRESLEFTLQSALRALAAPSAPTPPSF